MTGSSAGGQRTRATGKINVKTYERVPSPATERSFGRGLDGMSAD
jgi:hypothetical protein